MSVNGSLQPTRRPLTAGETRLLRARISSLRDRGQRVASAGLWIGIGAIAILCALTLLASDAPPLVITGFWLVAGIVIILWTRRDLDADRRAMASNAAGLQSALSRNLALVYDIRSTGFVEFEEMEDEGACYAFQLKDTDKLVFISGQEFYDEARFPSLDFALVFPLDESDRRVDMLIDKRGAKASPVRRIPAAVKANLTIPEDLQLVQGDLSNIEGVLRARRS